MAQFKQWFYQDLTEDIVVRHCESVMFTGDDKGALVGVRLFDDGPAYSGGGTVSGAVKRSDGGLVALTGTLSGNAASVVIPAAALACPGPIGVHIILTQGDSTTTVLKAIYAVDDNTGAAIDPGTIIPSINDLITAINNAVASIPSDYSALLHTLAPDFSASKAYAAGDYVWYNGTLYRFTADHAAGSWAGTDAKAAVIGTDLSDLKSAFSDAISDSNDGLVDVGIQWVNGEYVTLEGAFEVYNGWSRTPFISVTPGEILFYTATRASAYNAFYDSDHQFLSTFNVGIHSDPQWLAVPSNAYYIALSNKNPDAEATGLKRLSAMATGAILLNTLKTSKPLLDGDDLFTLGPGLYFWNAAGTLANSPTVNAFKLIIGLRNSPYTYTAVLFDSSDQVFISNRPTSGAWHDWKRLLRASDYNDLFMRLFVGLDGVTQISDGTDLYELEPGCYTSSASNLSNCPTEASFRLWIFNRTTARNSLAILIDSMANVFTNSKLTSSWTGWIQLNQSNDSGYPIPQYYTSYIAEKAQAINDLHDSLSINSDSFIFLTDYHILRNEQHSPALIHYLLGNTGLRRLVFGGDAYQTNRTSKAEAEKYVAYVYAMLNNLSPWFFPILGNHEWNHYQIAATECLQEAYEISLAGVYNYCISRCEPYVTGMSAEGNYYYDNDAKKIRYLFLQYDGESRPTQSTLDWLANKLTSTPLGYYVMAIAHYANMDDHAAPSLTSYAGRNTYFNQMVADILQAYNVKGAYTNNFSFTANGVTKTYNCDYDFSSAPGNNVICILGGHWHEDDAVEKTATNILSVLTTGDLCKTGSGDIITYIEDGETFERTPGTVREQAFDVVSIDTDARKIYFTRIGGGADREFTW